MRISDWSSDVCSSDLEQHRRRELRGKVDRRDRREIGRLFLERILIGATVKEAVPIIARKVCKIRHAGERNGTSIDRAVRSEESRVGKEGVSTCRSRGPP